MNNLPIPQSRSEELMNAFIQRDSSQISTPQSRIEEFWYHLIEGTNSLPIPQSRNELLLKKIIENDTHQIPLAQSRTEEFLVSILTGDINKLPIPQSRSEYYLDYIARNNLLLNDIDYVRYSGTNITATNTVQKPFRSAILKGQTLVNLATTESAVFRITGGEKIRDTDGYFILDSENKDGSNGGYYEITFKYPYSYNKTYTVMIYVVENSLNEVFKDYGFHGIRVQPNQTGVFIKTFNVNYDDSVFRASLSPTSSGRIKFRIVMLEGDYTNQDIPYFEGMQSVKLPVLTTMNVVNLLDVKQYEHIETVEYIFNNIIDSRFEKTFTFVSNGDFYNSWVKPFETNEFGEKIIGGWKLNVQSEKVGVNNKLCFTVPNDVDFFKLQISHLNRTEQLSYGFNDYSYGELKHEPYKSNILSCNEEVVLHRIKETSYDTTEIRDELDLVNGIYTKKLTEVKITDDMLYVVSENDEMIVFGLKWSKLPDIKVEGNVGNGTKVLCNLLQHIYVGGKQGIFAHGMRGEFQLTISKTSSISTEAQIRQWFKDNDLTIIYQLENPIIKTVDLKVVNQDGNQVKELSAFDGTTHIVSGSASDNSLIAITEVEVPTKLIEVLDGVKSLSSDVEILINEVDNTQKLQDENSTMAMSAMTELYEMILMMGGND